ncbi:HepT-like ribonuclease domain-containing protein [Microbacterium sp. S1037]
MSSAAHSGGGENFAAHQYDDLDPHRVWRTLTRDVPRLREYLTDVVVPAL